MQVGAASIQTMFLSDFVDTIGRIESSAETKMDKRGKMPFAMPGSIQAVVMVTMSMLEGDMTMVQQ